MKSYRLLYQTSVGSVLVAIILALLGTYSALGQEFSHDSIGSELVSPERNPAILKFSVFPLVSGLFSNRLYLGLQYEKAFAKHPKFSFTNGLLYSRTYTGVFGNGVQLWTSQQTIFIIRPGIRYYIRKSPEVYRGFFVSLSPFYTYGEYNDQTEYRQGVGADAMIGYQRVFNRWTLEVNYSLGMARNWYEYTYNLPFEQGEYKVYPWAQINIGYSFY